MKKTFYYFLGIIIPISIIQVVYINLSIKYNYYSGINPYSTLFYIPLYLGISACLGLVILRIIRRLKLQNISKVSVYFRFGLVLGCLNVGSHILFWFFPKVIEMVVYAIVIVVAFFVALNSAKT